MTLILLIIQIILAFCLVMVVLFQKSGSEGWSGLASSASGAGIMSKKSSNNFLTKTTIIIAVFFMLNSLVLANLIAKKNNPELDKIPSLESNDGKKESTNQVPFAE